MLRFVVNPVLVLTLFLLSGWLSCLFFLSGLGLLRMVGLFLRERFNSIFCSLSLIEGFIVFLILRNCGLKILKFYL